MTLKTSIEALHALMQAQFPQVADRCEILELGPGTTRVRLAIDQSNLRPGGTVSGPSMFAAADLAFYIATMSVIGAEALTVTTNVSINFMRKPAPGDLIADARVLKLGRTLSVGDATVYSEGDERPVAHAAVTYAIPPRR